MRALIVTNMWPSADAPERGSFVRDQVRALRALDGVEVEVRLGPLTRFRLNGQPATLTDLQPGFVAEAVHYGARPALRVRAFGRVATAAERGRLVGVRDAWLVLRADSARVRRHRPLTGPADAHAPREGWKRLDHARRFRLRH